MRHDFLGSLLNRIGGAVHRASADALEPSGVSPRIFGLLAQLDHGGRMSQTTLSQLTGIDRTTMVRVIDDLESRALVERRRDPDDRRAYEVTLTDAGRALVEQHRRELQEIEDDALSALSPDQAEHLRSLLRIVAESVDPREAPSDDHDTPRSHPRSTITLTTGAPR